MMAINNTRLESLCTFLEHMEAQKNEMKSELQAKVCQQIDTGVDAIYSQLINGLMNWASANLSTEQATALTTTIIKVENSILSASDSEDIPQPVSSSTPIKSDARSNRNADKVNSERTVQIKKEILREVQEQPPRCASPEIFDDSAFMEPEDDWYNDNNTTREDTNDDGSEGSHISESPMIFPNTHPSPGHGSIDPHVRNLFEPEAEPTVEEEDESRHHRVTFQPLCFIPSKQALSAARNGEEHEKPKKSSKFRTKILYCNSCDKNFALRDYLERHKLNTHHVKEYQCHQRNCGRSYSSSVSLNLHLGQSHGELKEFQCGLCDRSFKDNDCLGKHMFIRHTMGLFVCTVGECTFSGRTQFEMNKHHTLAHQAYVCGFPNCGKSFAYKAVLEGHELNHLGLRLYHCCWSPGCTFTCAYRSSMVKHIRVTHFNLPSSKTEQRRLEIVDTRNVNHYFDCLDVEAIKQMAKGHQFPQIPASFFTRVLAQVRKQQEKRPFRHRLRHRIDGRLRRNTFFCRWVGCQYGSIDRQQMQAHINNAHSKRKTGMVAQLRTSETSQPTMSTQMSPELGDTAQGKI